MTVFANNYEKLKKENIEESRKLKAASNSALDRMMNYPAFVTVRVAARKAG